MGKRRGETREEYNARTRDYFRAYARKRRAADPGAERAQQRKQRETRPEIGRSGNRTRGKNITAAGVRALLASNDGTCDVCGAVCRVRSNGWDGRHIDHDHATGIVRGILCSRCNLAMGYVDAMLRNPAWGESLFDWAERGRPAATDED